jgi:hypothetical protein
MQYAADRRMASPGETTGLWLLAALSALACSVTNDLDSLTGQAAGGTDAGLAGSGPGDASSDAAPDGVSDADALPDAALLDAPLADAAGDADASGPCTGATDCAACCYDHAPDGLVELFGVGYECACKTTYGAPTCANACEKALCAFETGSAECDACLQTSQQESCVAAHCTSELCVSAMSCLDSCSAP